MCNILEDLRTKRPPFEVSLGPREFQDRPYGQCDPTLIMYIKLAYTLRRTLLVNATNDKIEDKELQPRTSIPSQRVPINLSRTILYIRRNCSPNFEEFILGKSCILAVKV
ncbi:hypothetical protein COP2_015176 [Malus domestica]